MGEREKKEGQRMAMLTLRYACAPVCMGGLVGDWGGERGEGSGGEKQMSADKKMPLPLKQAGKRLIGEPPTILCATVGAETCPKEANRPTGGR